MSEILRVKVTPNAHKTEIMGTLDDGTIKIRLHALPEKGKANIELLRYISEEYGGNWELVSGITTQKKTLRRLEEK